MSSAIPWFWPGLVVSLLIALLLGRRVAAFFGASTWNGVLLLLSVGAIVAATLTPDGGPSSVSAISTLSCDVTRVGLDTIRAYLVPSETSLNVILFVPLGLAMGLLPNSRRRTLAIAGAFGATFVVEGIQMIVTPLGRGCQTADLVDNTLGVAVGLGLALIGSRLVAHRRASGPPRPLDAP